MSRFEDELRRALRREEPPDGFAERVMARIQNRDREAAGVRAAAGPWRRLLAAFRAPRLRWATACAAAVLLVGGLEYRAQRLERAEGERAGRQVMLALRITGSKLRLAQARVRRIGYAPVER